jgi:hypothetical protein
MWLSTDDAGSGQFKVFGSIRIQLNKSAGGTNPSRDGGILLAFEDDRRRFAESGDAKLRLVAVATAINGLGIGNHIRRPALSELLIWQENDLAQFGCFRLAV